MHETEPGVDVDRGLSAQGVVAGGSIALGALISGGLILWDPLTGHSALLLPLLCWAGLNVVHLVAVLVLMDEPTRDDDRDLRRRAAASTREAPMVIREGLGLLRRNPVLLTVVLVEVFMTIGLVVFEIFQPIRLAELVGGEEQAGALMGPVAAVGWGVFALGSALAGFASPGSASRAPPSSPGSSTASARSRWAWSQGRRR